MKIAGVELIEVHLTLTADFVTGAGARRRRTILLLRVLGEEGATGWGECVAGEAPTYTYETTATARHILLEHLLPGLPGREFLGPDEIEAALAGIRGHPMAKGCVEMALWDLAAKELGVPLHEMLGGSSESVAVGVVVGYQPDRAALLAKVEEHLAHGYARVKLKIGPGHDVGVVAPVRERFPDASVSVDAGGSYSKDALPHLLELDAFELDMIEQPFSADDLLTHAALAERSDTRICLDESIMSENDALTALELGACTVINVKPGRVGGLGTARRIVGTCSDRGVAAWVGGMLETGIGRAHNLALATLPGFVMPGDLSESRRYWDRDIVAPEFMLEGGRMPIPEGPGIGVEVDEAAIRAAAVDSRVFGRIG